MSNSSIPSDPDRSGGKEEWHTGTSPEDFRPLMPSDSDSSGNKNRRRGRRSNNLERGDDRIDPGVYQEARDILGRENIPDYAQYDDIMDDPEAAKLAHDLTNLRLAPGRYNQIAQQIDYFISALQNTPSNQQQLQTYYRNIRQGGENVSKALDRVCSHPSIKHKLGFRN